MKIADSIIKKIKGFGLIEVLLSTVVLGVGLVGVAQFQGNVYKDGSLSKQRAEALKLAEKRLEELRHFSTFAEYQSNITSSLTNMKSAQNTVSGDTTTFTLNTYIKPDSSGKTADLSVKVTWPDLTNSGSVTTDTTVRLSTVVSNSTPNNLAMTSLLPDVIDPTQDPDIPVIIIDIFDPTDTRTNVSDNDDACECNTTETEITTTASLDPSFFGVPSFSYVGMRRSTSSTANSTTTVTIITDPNLSDACTTCCTEAGMELATIQTNTFYAQLVNEIEALLNEESSDYQKISLGDHVIDQNQFNPDFLRKGYQPQKNIALNNGKSENYKNTDYENFLHRIKKRRGGGTTTTTTTTSETSYGLCGYVEETITTNSATTITFRNRMMGGWTQ